MSSRLSASEAAQTKFTQDNLEFLGNVKFRTKLENARADLQKTRRTISELEVTQKVLEQQLETIPKTLRSATSSSRGGKNRDPLDERIAENLKKLDQLKILGYTDRHPDVVNVRILYDRLIEQKKAQQEALAAELSGSGEVGKNSTLTQERPNRLYEQVMLENIGAIGDVRRLEAREISQVAQVADLVEKSKRVPEILAEQSELKRNFSNLKSKLKKLQKQKIDIELQQGVTSTEQAVTFRVIEPPVTPQKPSGPPRLLYMIAVLVGALVSGFGVALLLSQLKPVIITVEQLRNHFDLPVLGNVTRSMSDVETRQRSTELLGYAGSTAMLFVVFAIFIAMDIFGSPAIG
jgi:protein tyrosine kinase modulator